MNAPPYLKSALALCLLAANFTSCNPADEAEEQQATEDVIPQEILVTDLAPLVGSEWKLVDLCGTEMPGDANVTLSFLPDDRISGRSSVNRYNGPFRLTDDGIETGPFATTRMAGPPAAMERERTYLAAIEAAKSLATIDEDRLVIAVDGEQLPLRYKITTQP